MLLRSLNGETLPVTLRRKLADPGALESVDLFPRNLGVLLDRGVAEGS